jgi:hypothetical protein
VNLEINTVQSKFLPVNVDHAFYGDNVIKIANGYADDIAAIEGK